MFWLAAKISIETLNLYQYVNLLTNNGVANMRIPTNTLQRLIYHPRKILFSRSLLACVLVSIFVAGAVYVKQRNVQRQVVVQTETVYQETDADHSQSIAAMQAHIVSLNSRIKHLAVDNKRLSIAGHKLSEQLHNSNITMREKLAYTKELQSELYSMDQHLIFQYDQFIEQQINIINLKSECEKSKDKNTKCHNYYEINQALDASKVQIKFLKNKRDVLLSEISRTAAGI